MTELDLTPRQLQILALIRSGCNSFWDLAEITGMAGPGGIDAHLQGLKAKGLVTWQPGKARTLQLTKAGWQAVVGYVLGPGGTVGKWEGAGNAECRHYWRARGNSRVVYCHYCDLVMTFYDFHEWKSMARESKAPQDGAEGG